MIYPIVLYGNPILRKPATSVQSAYPLLHELIDNMWQTMYASKGVGLAAPQVNHSLRLFIVDTLQMFVDDASLKEKYNDDPGIKKVFLNPLITEAFGALWAYEEGCLSFPNVRSLVQREQYVRIRYQDEHFHTHEQVFSGLTARVIFHEYDHIEGKLFIDKISTLKKKIIASRLKDISKGKVQTFYKVTL